MNINKLTTNFQQALSDAQSLAVGKDHNMIESAHVLSAMLDQQNSSLRHLLVKAGVNINKLNVDLQKIIENLPTVSGNAGQVNMSNDLVRVLNVCDKLAQKRGDQYIASAPFSVALLEANDTTGQAPQAAAANKESIQTTEADLRCGSQVNDQKPAQPTHPRSH